MNRNQLVASIFAILFVALLGFSRQIWAANGNALLWVNPASSNVNVGETVTVTIQLDQATDVFGIELEMVYDPSIVQIVDADSGTNGVQILPGACPAPDFIIQNTAYNITGTMNYAVTQLNLPGCDGGTVAQVAFQGISNGTSPFDFSASLIADSQAVSITHTTQNGIIIVGPTPTPSETDTPTPTESPTVTITPSPTNTPTPTETPSKPLLSLQPDDLSIAPGESGYMAVQLDNVSNVYGIDFSIQFDSAILAIVDADTNQTGIQIAPGDCPQAESVVSNNVENEIISYIVTQLNPTPPCDGGVVATIQFQCLESNMTSMVTFTESLIASPDGKIPHTTADAVVNCMEYFTYLPFIFVQSP